MVTVSDGDLSLIQLSAGAAECRVCPARGAIVTSLRLAGRERIYLDRATFLDLSKNVRGGIPILFPICGPLTNDLLSVDGQSYTLKQHGLARQAVWQLVDGGESWVEVGFRADAETLKSFPWDFELRFRFELESQAEESSARLVIKQRYLNHSERPMPLQFGFHPYFAVEDKASLKLDIPAPSYHDTVTHEDCAFTGRLDFSQETLDLEFAGVHAEEASLFEPASGSRVTLQYPLGDFPYLVFWTLKGRDFVCLEPWSGPRFGMSTGRHLKHVAPGSELTTWVAIKVA